MASKVLQYLVVIFLLFSIVQSSYLLYKVDKAIPQLSQEHKTTAGVSSGQISLCINSRPVLGVPCNSTADQEERFTCQLNGTDANSNDNLTFNATFINGTRLFNVTSDGLIDFTPTNNDTGNYTINFTLTDSSACINNVDSELFNLTVKDVNDPPFLTENISDVNLEENETVRAFFLDNHFDDPDNDPLTYNVSGVDEANVTILNSSEVVIKSSTCGFQDVVIFTAKDSFNLTAESNEVTIRCQEDEEQQQQQQATAGGGGGGGGGASLTCRSNFECRDHIPCDRNNTKVKRCVDINGCKETELITVECNYQQSLREECTENWVCDEWGDCRVNGTQVRECTDLNSCGTELDKPETTRSCDYTPTCEDGVKNGNETGVDCGGDCEPCQRIESPTPIQEDKGFLTSALMWLIAAILLSMLAYKYEHERIYRALSYLGLHFAGRVPKEVLLGDEERDELLSDIKEIQDNISSGDVQELADEFLDVAKSFFFHALELEIDMGKEDLLAELEERKVNEHLKRVLASFFDKTIDIEFSAEPVDGYELMYLIEELREIVVETSEWEQGILEAKVTEYSIPDDLYELEKAYLRLVNAYIPLHFNELETAVNKYMEVLEFYETLGEQQKDQVYSDVSRLYQKIRYRAAWIQNM